MSFQNNEFELLDQGSNSNIYLSRGESDFTHLILKTVDLTFTKQANHLFNQYQLLSDLDHQHIVKPLAFKASFPLFGSPKHVIILNYAKHRSLLDFIKKRKCTVPQIRHLFKQVCSAVLYLHQKNVVHRDLKLENALVFEEENGEIVVKLSDFGYADHCFEEQRVKTFSTEKGTRRGYMAPEIHQVLQSRVEYDGRPSDVFSLGVMLFAMLFKKLPFEYAKKQNNIYKFISEQKFDLFWNYHSKDLIKKSNEASFMQDDLQNLLHSLLSANPQERLSVKQIMEHPWMNGQEEAIKIPVS